MNGNWETSKETIDKLARECIEGKYGKTRASRANIESMGVNYDLVKERIKDTTAPVCKFTSESSKVRTGKTTKVYLTCDDASGFKNTNLSVNNFGVNKILGISLLRIENVKLIKQTSTSSTWEIGVKGKGLGKAKLYLNENAVSDKFDNKNAKTYATTPIKVTLF